MSPLNLSKEHKQYVVLGAIVAVLLVVLIVFGIKVSLTSISAARLELVGLTEKIRSADITVTQNERDSAEFLATITELKAHLANIPPERNYYSWATEIIYKEARMVQFEVDAIDEAMLAAPVEDPKEEKGVDLESYSLRINAHGGYESVKKFLNRIAVYHPLVRVTGVEISTGSEPEDHNIQIFIEWPFNLGYISESWGSSATNSPSNKTPVAKDSLPTNAPAAVSQHGATEPIKKPVPPSTRPGSSGGSVALPSGIPMAAETNLSAGKNETQQEGSGR